MHTGVLKDGYLPVRILLTLKVARQMVTDSVVTPCQLWQALL